MSKRAIFKTSVYFLGFVLPILGMFNCTGFAENTMAVSSCFIDNGLTRTYADFYYSWLTLSSFMFFIPIIIYSIAVYLVAKYLSRLI